MKIRFIKVLLVLFSFCILLTGCDKEVVDEIDGGKQVVEDTSTGYIVDAVEIKKIDDSNYEFEYNGEIFKVLYVTDTWKIYDSYKITNSNDIRKICKTLIDIHPIYGRDMVSYRTEDDMAYEWMQHNLAYQVLPDSNSFKNSAKDVDLDPNDQGKSLVEIYEDRTGQKLDLRSLLK